MKKFQYTAFDESGRREEGVIEAANLKEAGEKLFSSLLRPIHIEEIKKGLLNPPSPFQNRKRLSLFCHQWAALLDAGLSVTEALALLEEGGPKKERKILREVMTRVASGHSISQSFIASKAFPPFLTAMIEVGELSGTLPEELRQIAAYYHEERQWASGLQKALAYPCFILFFSLMILFFTVVVILPSFASLFVSLGVPLPAMTAAAIKIGKGLRAAAPYLAVIFLLLSLFGIEFKKTASGQEFWENQIFKISIVRKILFIRFCSMAASLLESGKPLSDALEDIGRVIGNQRAAKEIRRMARKIRNGDDFGDIIKKSPFSFPVAARLIEVGMESGELSSFIREAAQLLTEETKEWLAKFRAILEPLMLFIVSAIVLVLLFSIMIPVLRMSGQIMG